MKKILSVMLVATLTCVSFAAQDWAQFSFYQKKNEEVKTKPVAVFMGDSITFGWAKHCGYFFKENNFIGRGIGGQVTSQMLVRLRKDVIDLKPEYAVILAGTNDIAQNQGYISVENICGNIISMVEILKANNIKPVVCSVLPVKRYPWRKQIESIAPISQLNAMLKDYCQKNNVKYVDYYSALVDSEKGLPKEYAEDGVHPTVAGFKIMQKIILEALKK